MKHGSALVALLFLSASQAGCSGESAPDDATGGAATGGTSATGGSSPTGGASGSSTGGTSGAPSCNGMVTANAVNNYSFSSTLTFPPITVQPDTELTFGWEGVTTDFLGHPLDPMTGVDNVNLMLWSLTQAELETKLNADDLAQRDLAVIANLETGNTMTEAALFDFTSVGMPITPEDILPFVNATSYPPEENTYTVMITEGTVLGEGTRMIQAFKLDPTSTNTHVELTDTSTHLEYMVDLDALTPTRIPAGPIAVGSGDVTIDWGNMTLNALGNEFVPTEITQALVAHYMQPLSELEARFLDLDIIDADRWRGEIVSGTSVTLSSLTNESGQAFAGIDGTGTWVVALICGSCRNPAPWYLSVLTTCSP